MIEVAGLTKRFGDLLAVDELSFECRPGRVTGFLGPNGAGKTTTLRMLLGLVTPTAVPRPSTAAATPTSRTRSAPSARRWRRRASTPAAAAAPTCGCSPRRVSCPTARVDEVLELVGLADAGRRRVGATPWACGNGWHWPERCSATPGPVLDEPANGLDPEGIAWLRGFLRHLAGEGRTVLVSSHVLAEVQQTVDDVVIVARGRLVLACPLDDLDASAARTVVVRTPDVGALRAMLEQGVDGQRPTAVQPQPDGPRGVRRTRRRGRAGRAPGGRRAARAARGGGDLERAFLDLTRDTDDPPVSAA